MRKLLRILGVVAFWSYFVALVVLGAAGLLVPRPELATLYGLDLGPLQPAAASDFLHQYRFLKAFVLGFAVFCWVFRREILRPGIHHTLFLITLFTAVGGRVLSLALDGQGNPRLFQFTISEVIFGLLIFAAARVAEPRKEST